MNPNGGWRRWQPRATQTDNINPGERLRWVENVNSPANPMTVEWAMPGAQIVCAAIDNDGNMTLYLSMYANGPRCVVVKVGAECEMWDNNGPAPLRWVLRIWSVLRSSIVSIADWCKESWYLWT